jgi:molecular chaperone GrpE
MEKEEKQTKEKEKSNKKEQLLEKEIEKLREELSEEKSKTMRIQAEMINFKKRKEEELSNFLKYANEGLIGDLLPIVDNFERAIKMDNDDLSDEISRFLEGFKMIYGNLISILNKCEVKEIEADGIEFNPNYHQAVLTEKDETKPQGVVLEVLQKGYMYKDKVIRPAMVKVNE